MHFYTISIFPDFFDAFFRTGLIGRAIAQGTLKEDRLNPRDFTTDRHRSVDDTPYGGGPGMILKVDSIVTALEAIEKPARRILLSPSGAPFNQRHAERLAGYEALAFICGRYEGIDERVSHFIDEEISVGDFVLFGGEVAAMAVMEAVSRLVPGVMGNEASIQDESHQENRLEYAQYTRPPVFRDHPVPDILMSGNHEAIATYRHNSAAERTRKRRPDLLNKAHSAAQPEKQPAESSSAQNKSGVYCALVHYPVKNKQGDKVSTAITNLDVHDLARSARTYNLRKYFVVTPIATQRELVERILSHWHPGDERKEAGKGTKRIPDRAEALRICAPAASVEEAIKVIEETEGKRPKVILTAASANHETLSFDSLREKLQERETPYLILFGTGHGLHPSLLEEADALLEAIHGVGGYNHLSVRAATAIILDRLLGR